MILVLMDGAWTLWGKFHLINTTIVFWPFLLHFFIIKDIDVQMVSSISWGISNIAYSQCVLAKSRLQKTKGYYGVQL